MQTITIGWVVGLVMLTAGSAAAEPFEKVWCLRYATAPQAPLSLLLAGAPAEDKADLPFAMCVAQRGDTS